MFELHVNIKQQDKQILWNKYLYDTMLRLLSLNKDQYYQEPLADAIGYAMV